jgi:hypothetical protein
MSAPPLFSFWTGPVSWFEQLSARSAIAAGHELTVFSYDPPDPVWERLGVRVAHAETLWPLGGAFDHAMMRQKPGHFSDHLRFEGLAQNLGVWMDLDCMLVRPIPYREHLYAWENPAHTVVGTSVLRMPSGSPALADLLAFCRRRPFVPVPPHWGAARRLSKTVRWYRDRLLKPGQLTTVLGPDILTGALHRHDLTKHARPHGVYFPLWQMDTVRALVPGALPTGFGGPDMVMIHMWCKRCGLAGPLPGSWLGDLASRLDMPLAPLDDAARRCLADMKPYMTPTVSA